MTARSVHALMETRHNDVALVIKPLKSVIPALKGNRPPQPPLTKPVEYEYSNCPSFRWEMVGAVRNAAERAS